MIQKSLLYLFSALTVLNCSTAWAQKKGAFTINPYLVGNFSLSDKYLEVGPSIDQKKRTLTYFDAQGNEIRGKQENYDANRSRANTLTISHRLFARIPLANEGGNVGLIDRQLNDVRLAYSYAKTGHTLQIQQTDKRYVYRSVGVKLEGGYKKFTYYPTGDPSREENFNSLNVAFEVTGGIYISTNARNPIILAPSPTGTTAVRQNPGQSEADNTSPTGFQVRLRIDHQFSGAAALGVTGQPVNGLATTRMLILDKPSNTTTISPAGAWIRTSNTQSLQQVVALYADARFSNELQDYRATRLRLEYWILLLPDVKGLPNTKLGVGPLLNYRVDGSDGLRKVEAGIQATVRLNSLPARFFD
jgi:hypothetical protein